MEAVRAAGVEFLLGGAFGLAAYTGRWRNTKDIDFFVLPEAREAAVAALTRIGFTDYYDTLAYDRGWIYRATREGVIVDIIWSTPNRRAEVDGQWFARARPVQVRNEELRAIPAEELLWIKLYVMQRDRCDWPDLINLLYAASAQLDWEHVKQRLQDDLPLLQALLLVFAWVCPDRVSDLPAALRKGTVRPIGRRGGSAGPSRIDLLDSRPWFAALQPCEQPMQL
jgi:hypothetical protein